MPVCDGSRDTGYIAMWLDPVEFACLNQRGDDGTVMRPCIVTRQDRVFSVEGDGADCAFDGVVFKFDATITEEKVQPVPVFCDVFQGLSGWRFGRDAGAVLGQPKLEVIDDRF